MDKDQLLEELHSNGYERLAAGTDRYWWRPGRYVMLMQSHSGKWALWEMITASAMAER